MTDGLFAWMGPRICEWLAQGKPDKKTFMARGSYGIFRTKDGKYLSLGTVEAHFWENFCRLIGRTDLLIDKYHTWEDRNKYSEELKPIMEKVIGEKDRDEWLKLGEENNIPVSPVNALVDLDADPHLVSRGLVERTGTGTGNSGYFVNPFPVKFSEKRDTKLSPAPEVGEHKKALLRGLGYGDEEIASLEREKVI
jgi:crotonobetainyl-CoA:carnitine CoA-transferase CaiB-like acyl-CoA transferase